MSIERQQLLRAQFHYAGRLLRLCPDNQTRQEGDRLIREGRNLAARIDAAAEQLPEFGSLVDELLAHQDRLGPQL